MEFNRPKKKDKILDFKEPTPNSHPQTTLPPNIFLPSFFRSSKRFLIYCIAVWQQQVGAALLQTRSFYPFFLGNVSFPCFLSSFISVMVSKALMLFWTYFRVLVQMRLGLRN